MVAVAAPTVMIAGLPLHYTGNLAWDLGRRRRRLGDNSMEEEGRGVLLRRCFFVFLIQKTKTKQIHSENTRGVSLEMADYLVTSSIDAIKTRLKHNLFVIIITKF